MLHLSKNSLVIFLTSLLLVFSSHSQSFAQTANTYVKPHTGDFGYGANMGYYGNGWDDLKIAGLISKIGGNANRPTLPGDFIERWGINVRLKEFQAYSNTLGMKEITCFIERPSAAQQDNTIYPGCSQPSKLWANLYKPIWRSDGTVNPENYYAAYVLKLVHTYGDYVRYWEVVNEPDVSGVNKANWLTRAPSPSETPNTRAPFFHYIRMLRITYEVVKKYRPDNYVTTGGIGYTEYLDALLRYTDNPDGGAVTSEYPNKGGAYFDVLSFHVYPSHFLRVWDNGGFKYLHTSEYAAEQVIKQKNGMESVLAKYGYNGSTYPKKHFITTETDISKRTADWRYSSDEMQRNFAIKALVLAQKNGMQQMQFFGLSDAMAVPPAGQVVASSDEYKLMGFYETLSRDAPGSEKVTDKGRAFHTTTTMLKGYRYEASRTASLNLPDAVQGAAFVKNGEYVYVLWAKTLVDKSEKATATYSFPASLGMSGVSRFEWDFAATGRSSNQSPASITLNGSPSFFKPNGITTPLKSQTITFGALPAKTFGDPAFTVSATASSSLPVSFAIKSGPARIFGNTVTLTGAGTVVVEALQTGNTTFAPAASVSQSFSVSSGSSTTPPADCSATGSILLEQWAGVLGSQVSAIPVNTAPSSTSQLTMFEAKSNVGDRFGARIRGYICPPTTGDYTFWVAGDDTAELWLSTSDSPSGKVKIAYTNSSTRPREWNRYATQKSASIRLEAGKRYYIEALHKEEWSADHIAVGWQLPHGQQEMPIAGSRLSPYGASQPSTTTSQTITFAAISDKTVGAAPVGLSATASSGLPVSFSISTSPSSGVASLSGGTVTLSGGTGTVTITASQAGNTSYSTAQPVQRTFTVSSGTATTPPAGCSATGSILLEQWAGVPGSQVSAIPVNTAPSSTSQLTIFEAKSNVGDRFGARIRGYICPPTTGDYTFWVAGDDAAELWLSTSDSPSGKVKIAYTNSSTRPREWNRYATQKSASIRLEAGKRYYIEALHKEEWSADHIAVGWQLPNGQQEMPIAGSRLSPFGAEVAMPAPAPTPPPSTPAPAPAPSGCSATGTILREQWNMVLGNQVSAIPVNTAPSSTSQLTIFEAKSNVGDRFGARIRGYICPPTTGDYTFWVAGDDAAELWLSTSDSPSGKVKIAYTNSSTRPREWNRYATQKSASIRLEAGKRYYIEALHKEEWSADHIAVGWQLPNGQQEMPIAGDRLSPYDALNANATQSLEIGTTLATESELTAYPNPFTTSTRVQFTLVDSDEVTLEVYDMQGKLIRRLYEGTANANEAQSFELEATGLSHGMYIIKLATSSGVLTEKVLLTY